MTAHEASEAYADQIDYLWNVFARLGPNGKRVLMQVAKRLEIGAGKYGDFVDSRDMDKEAREELLDAIIYAAHGVRLTQAGEVP